MASDMSKLLKKAVKEYNDEISRQADERIEIALKKTMAVIETEIEKYIDLMASLFYDGYEPLWYVRDFQLQKKSTRPVTPLVKLFNSGEMSSLSFGVRFDEARMNHGSYEVKARWYDKKNKKWKDVKKSSSYKVTPGKKKGSGVSESKILEFFMEGIHPNAAIEGFTEFPTPQPLYIDDGYSKDGAIPKIIEEWVESGALQEIFTNELKKIIM